jgi:hypothetical protein
VPRGWGHPLRVGSVPPWPAYVRLDQPARQRVRSVPRLWAHSILIRTGGMGSERVASGARRLKPHRRTGRRPSNPIHLGVTPREEQLARAFPCPIRAPVAAATRSCSTRRVRSGGRAALIHAASVANESTEPSSTAVIGDDHSPEHGSHPIA